MAKPLISHERQFEPAFEPVGSYAWYELDSLRADELHARALQRRLADAFAPEIAGHGILWDPSPAQRLGLITGASALLWIMIGAGVLILMR